MEILSTSLVCVQFKVWTFLYVAAPVLMFKKICLMYMRSMLKGYLLQINILFCLPIYYRS